MTVLVTPPKRRNHDTELTMARGAMSERDDEERLGGPLRQRGTAAHTGASEIRFNRREIDAILRIYGRKVAAGEWRDYAMSFLREMAVFSVFRRAAEYPLYRIEKHPRLRNRQGMYALIGMDGQVLKRGQDLAAVLRVLDRKLIRPVE